jgi:hypothetical protein
MAWGNFVLDVGFDAAAPVTKFYAVKFGATPETVTPVTGIADLMVGIAQFNVLAAEILQGKGSSVRVMGVSEAVAASAIALGALVTMEADGRFSTWVSASGKRVVGRCIGTPAVNAGDVFSLLVNPFGLLA